MRVARSASGSSSAVRLYLLDCVQLKVSLALHLSAKSALQRMLRRTVRVCRSYHDRSLSRTRLSVRLPVSLNSSFGCLKGSVRSASVRRRRTNWSPQDHADAVGQCQRHYQLLHRLNSIIIKVGPVQRRLRAQRALLRDNNVHLHRARSGTCTIDGSV